MPLQYEHRLLTTYAANMVRRFNMLLRAQCDAKPVRTAAIGFMRG